MKKQELLKIMDNTLLDKLFGFCYARTSDSYEAQELCSDIVFALVKAANTDGEINNLYAYVWRVAGNVYADFCEKRRKEADLFYQGDSNDALSNIMVREEDDDSSEMLEMVCRKIAFLTKAYREVMIAYYLDGLSTAEIARQQQTSETAVRQRLFSARKKVKSEVEEMSEINNKPVMLDKLNFIIWGTGNLSWGDPRETCIRRQFSKHIIWLCRKKPMRATEIANKLNVPTMYVEEELGILKKGANGEYGFLRRLDNGTYAINVVLLDKDEIERAHAIYRERMPMICDVVSDFIEKHKEEYLAFPYLNKKVDFNLILWQQITMITEMFSKNVREILSREYFNDVEKIKRPFSVFGFLDTGKTYGCGRDICSGENICGYAEVSLDHIYDSYINKRFHSNEYVLGNKQVQLAFQAIDGIDIHALSEDKKEHAAKAIESGYLYREGDTLYTKILVNDMKDSLFDISERISDGFLEEEARDVAAKVSELIRKFVPEHLFGEWAYFNILASMPMHDLLVEHLIQKGVLIPPENGRIGAEGCWISVKP